jgi:hypothetical protein
MTKCKYENCNKQPSFNFKGELKGIFCKEHLLPNMINVKSKKCKNDLCNKVPHFNFEDEKIGLYCKEHSLPNMIDLYRYVALLNNLFIFKISRRS